MHYRGGVAVIIPMFNEEQSIGAVLDDLKILKEAEIFVFDNNSNDNSANIVKTKQNEFSNISLLTTTKQGKGAVIREAFSIIDAEIYVIIDADGEHDVSILPNALDFFKINHLDMLNIARNGDKSLYRKYHSFGNWFLTKFIQIFFGRKINDALSGYRIFNKAFVKSFPAESSGFEVESELTIFALQQNLRIDEIKANYKSRHKNSHSKLHTFKDGFKIALMIINLIFSEKPLVAFGILSLISLFCGIILGIPIVLEFLETSKVPRFPTLFLCIGLGVIAVILFISGFLAHLITRNIKQIRRITYNSYKRSF